MKDIICRARRELAERLADSDFKGWGYLLDEWCYELAVKVSPDSLINGKGWQEMGYTTDEAGSPFWPFDQTDVEPFRSALAAHVDELTQRTYSAFPPVPAPEAFAPRPPSQAEKDRADWLNSAYDEAQAWRARWGHPPALNVEKSARTVDEIADAALHPPADGD